MCKLKDIPINTVSTWYFYWVTDKDVKGKGAEGGPGIWMSTNSLSILTIFNTGYNSIIIIYEFPFGVVMATAGWETRFIYLHMIILISSYKKRSTNRSGRNNVGSCCSGDHFPGCECVFVCACKTVDSEKKSWRKKKRTDNKNKNRSAAKLSVRHYTKI